MVIEQRNTTDTWLQDVILFSQPLPTFLSSSVGSYSNIELFWISSFIACHKKIPSKVIFFLFYVGSSRRKISSQTKEKNGLAARCLNSRQFLENVQPDLGQKSFSEALLNSLPPLLATAFVFVKINYSFIHLLVRLNGQRVPLSANLWKLPIENRRKFCHFFPWEQNFTPIYF